MVRLLLRLAFAVGALGAAAGTAWAQPPVTDTQTERFSESFSDEPFLCNDELYAVTANGRSVTHVTFFEDTGAVHFHEIVHARVDAVPLDGTGTSYTGTFRVSDSENIRAVGRGELVEVDTDLDRVVPHGSDGTHVFLKEHAHFTINANGDATVEFSTARMSCP
jgi:hypothetical protein